MWPSNIGLHTFLGFIPEVELQTLEVFRGHLGLTPLELLLSLDILLREREFVYY